MKLTQISQGLEGVSITGAKDIQITGLADDSRKVKEGNIFFAVKGLNRDGHEYIRDAIENGAVCVVCESMPSGLTGKTTFIVVKNVRDAIGTFSSNYFGNPSGKLKVIGVTGTKGKTTTVHFIYQLLTMLGKKVGMVSSISARVGGKEYDTGFHVTNPDCLSTNLFLAQMVKNRCEYAVLEVSSHGIAQKRIAGIKFDVGVLTNVAPEHLDYHKSFEEYINTKARFIGNAKTAVINSGDKSFLQVKKQLPGELKLVRYSVSGKAEVSLKNIPEAASLRGEFNMSNCLAAVATLINCGIDLSKIRKRIPKLQLPEGRLEEVKNNKGIRIVIDFAHTPESLESALGYLRGETKGKLIAVFGSAGERDPFKRPKMGSVASKIADIVILTAEDPRSEKVENIISQIKSGVSNESSNKVFEIPDRTEAIEFALKKAVAGDTVGIFGKGHERSMNLDGKLEIPWSDKKTTLEILETTPLSQQVDFSRAAAVVLAAGKGTRMKSQTQKTVHNLLGKPMVLYILDTLQTLNFGKVVIVVGHNKEQVITALGNKYSYVVQKEQKGNANALLATFGSLGNKYEHIFVFQGDDSFLYSGDLITNFYKMHQKKKSIVSVFTCDDNPAFPNTFWFVNCNGGKISEVTGGRVKQKNPRLKMLISTFIFNSGWLWKNLKDLRPSETSGEYILPDLVKAAIKQKRVVTGTNLVYKRDWLGVNSPEELVDAEKVLLKFSKNDTGNKNI